MRPGMSIQKVHDQGSGRLNEDVLLVESGLFGVFDGATSLVDFISKDRKTGGRLAAEIARQAFSENRKSLRKLAILANRRIKEEMQRERIDTRQKKSLWYTTAAVLRLREEERAEFFQTGDSLILAIYKNNNWRLLTEYQNHDLETMIVWRKLAEQREKDIMSKVRPQIEKTNMEANVRYGCLNGEKQALGFFHTGEIQLEDIKAIILFTDGLIIPKENPRDPENWQLFVKIYQKAGLRGLLRHVRLLEESDPNCWRYPRFKKHDDVAAIGIDFT